MFTLQNNNMEKICTTCKKLKSYDEYYNCKQSPDGKAYKCKQCANQYHKRYQELGKRSERDKVMEYLKHKVIMIKEQDLRRFPEYRSTLTQEDLLEVYDKYGGMCVYSNKKLKPGSKVDIFKKISFDRIDNSKPHCKENLQLTSQFMNCYRGGRDAEEFKIFLLGFN